MTLPKALICDLDSTLANCDHRLHFVERDHYWQPKEEGSEELIRCTPPGWKPDYEKFYAGIPDDGVNEWCRLLCEQTGLCIADRVFFITGRPEKYRDITEAWLDKYIDVYINDRPRCQARGWKLFMRPNFINYCPELPKKMNCGPITPDHRPSHEVKREIYEREIKDKYDVLFCLDDDERCCQAYRDLGLTVLKVM